MKKCVAYINQYIVLYIASQWSQVAPEFLRSARYVPGLEIGVLLYSINYHYISYWCLVGNGWECGNGIIIPSMDHSLIPY